MASQRFKAGKVLFVATQSPVNYLKAVGQDNKMTGFKLRDFNTKYSNPALLVM